jgi:GntR family transcriptional regulator/MocR family aminotransferase
MDHGSRVAELLLLEVLGGSGLSLREQLRSQLVSAVEEGRLRPGDRLPPSRQLARDLGIARGTVVDVYDQLVHDGYLIARTGSGTSVARRPVGPVAGPPPSGPVPMYDARPGGPDLSAFPRTAWAMATSHVLRTMPDAALGYAPPWGTAVLREQLVRYLARTRHVQADADGVLITSGVTQALTLLCRVLYARGHRVLAVEDPSNAIQRQVLGRYGLRIVDVPVDEHGIDVQALQRTGARAVLVTPAHQYPTGIMLSSHRRAELLSWAARCDGLIVEDDYDAEFPHSRDIVPSLQGAAPQHVAHVSSVSKTLAPGTRLGWLVPPRAWRDELVGAKRDDDFGTGVIGQHVLAHLITTGAYDRHLRRQRTVYRMRRQAMVAAFSAVLPDWRVRGAPAGLHLWLEPSGLLSESALVRAALDRDVLVLGMSTMCRTVQARGLVLGFARLRNRTPRWSPAGSRRRCGLPRTGRPVEQLRLAFPRRMSPPGSGRPASTSSPPARGSAGKRRWCRTCPERRARPPRVTPQASATRRCRQRAVSARRTRAAQPRDTEGGASCAHP